MQDNLQLPSLCIVIPTYNEEKFIGKAIRSILNNGYPLDKINIYIVDGMSNDRTVEMAQKLLLNSGVEYNVIKNIDRLPAFGINKVSRIAKEDILVRCDAHCEYEPDYLFTLINLLLSKKGSKLVAVGGVWRIESGEPNKLIALVVSKVVSSKWAVGPVDYRQISSDCAPKIVDTAPFTIFWRSDFNSLGGFDVEMAYSEDDELNFRFKKQGGEVWLHPKAASTYFARSSVSSLAVQYFRYGQGKARVLRKYRSTATWRQLVPLFHVIFSVIAILSSILMPYLLLYFIPYFVFLLLAMLDIKCRRGVRGKIIIPWVIVVVHFSYGFGYLKELSKVFFEGRHERKRPD